MEFKEIVSLMENVENPRSIYDIVSSNYYKMSKETLATIVKELDYAMHNILDNVEYETVKARFVESLEEIIEDEDNEEGEY